MSSATETETVLKIAIKNIEVDKENRGDLDIENLAASIKAAGLRQPVGVAKSGSKFRLVYGHRRLAACASLGWTHIRAESMGTLSDEDVMQLRAVENLDRQDLTPVQEAIAIAALVNKLPVEGTGDTRTVRAAKKLGKPMVFIRDRMYLVERCCKAVLAMAAKDPRITVGHLRQLAKVGDDKIQTTLCGYIIDQRSGNVRIQSIEDLREAIDSSQRSLDRVPWLLDKKVGKQPACIGCKSNTATDETLFGTDHKGADVGFCMDEGCYHGKERQIEAAKKVVAQKIAKLKEPSSEKAVVASKTPDYMKVATAQRYVKLNVKGIDKKKIAAAKKAGKATPAGKKKAGVDPNLKALEKYESDHAKWSADICEKINKAIADKNPLAVLAAYMMSELNCKGSEAIDKLEHWYKPVEKEYDTKIRGYKFKLGAKPKPVQAGVMVQLKRIVETGLPDIERMAKEALGGHGYYLNVLDDGNNPDLLIQAAKLLKVEAPERPAPPELKKKVKAAPMPKKKKGAKKKRKAVTA